MTGVLAGKKALITGGSRGIGRAIAESFLKEGASVWLVARKKEELDVVTKELSMFGDVRTSALNVADEIEMKKCFATIQSVWGSLDVLINSAGIYGPIGRVDEVSPSLWREATDVNLFGTFLATHFAVSLLRTSPRGVIINLMGGGEAGYPRFTSYVASKGGVVRFTETIAEELKEFHIDVNAIAPGAVNTQFLEEILEAGPERAGQATYEKSLAQKESGGTSPEKAAAMCVWLASDKSKGLTGKVLSAVWDEYEKFPERMQDIMSGDIYNFRRVRPGDRGFDWEKK